MAKTKWIFISGGTNYIFNSRDAFETFHAQLSWVQAGNRERTRSYQNRNIRVFTRVHGITHTVLRTDVTFATEMIFSLISKSGAGKA